ncbi:hypothetical protein SAMD00019534_057840 [Acytostelium subglobosum LB1]|uniref:hypothetical protein n=1 Tax=Acytostelium subglobosum LB1 TaxID=1410327 RepID=UPI000644D536|nr:hypothetical protein SAMD00019534_057840 [Acytostelium subglobosum LB1]GAM22609.1 hypothetical protein SAMD00019534_057840 [Acytostelium subglobosum LB1]|eukprot:XP_012754729.1 hypothetical protein SAMD00019534_057840 [Acytostelium subglobosum LB1]
MGATIIDCAILKTRFVNATVNVISTYADEFPPMIRLIKQHPAPTYLFPAISTKERIGWNITIEDHMNGFERGYINVTSNVDYTVRQIWFYLADRLPGSNATVGEYHVTFDIYNYTRSQRFTIQDIQLFDSSQNTATMTSGTGQVSMTISPTAYINDDPHSSVYSIKLNAAGTDLLPPSIISLDVVTTSINVGSINRNVTIRFTVNVTSGVGYDMDRMPMVYLTGHVFEIFTMKSKHIGNMEFEASGYLPYGFGATHGKVLVSIYGLMDLSSNYIGYTNRDLVSLALGTPTDITITFDHTIPIIENVALGDGTITVYGRNFGTDPNKLEGYFNSTTAPKASFHSGIMLVFPFTQTNSSLSMSIQVSYNNQSSNQMGVEVYVQAPVTPPPGTPPPVTPNVTVTCPAAGCSHGGVCSPTLGCVCTPGWYGEGCDSEAVPNIPTTLPGSPTTVYTYDDPATGQLYGDINVIKVRELDNDGQIHATYDLTKWNMTNTSPLITEYRTLFANDTASIKVTITWFNESRDVKFAGEVMSMSPSTIKYTIEVERYTFNSKLNSIQVVMAASINITDLSSCSTRQYGYADGSMPSVYWMRVKVQKYSLYGRFIQKALVDGRAAIVTNTLLNESLQAPDAHSSQTIIAINVQHFDDKVIMDPDFHLLIDTSDAKDSTSSDRTCPGGSNGVKLSPLAIAGIVVLCVAVVIGLGVAIALRHKMVMRSRRETLRVRSKMAELVEMNKK